ncbi:MAG: sulfotransferase domain-containing protein, partial [Flavobacteriales bacterium]
MIKTNFPNTFLIGVQKAATTSVFNWLSQHPDVCAPVYLKDLDFFTNDNFYIDKGLKFLSKQYINLYKNEKIILQGSVHYIFFETALKRIKQHKPNAKFILILRNPIERAISAYEYAVKFNFEQLPIEEAFNQEEERMKSNDIRTLSELTYKNHGLYFKQINVFLKYFKREQLKILTFQDVSKQPEIVVKEVFSFLNINTNFVPIFKNLNNTGELKNKNFQKLAFGNHTI